MIAITLLAGSAASASVPAFAADTPDIERGKYLVTKVCLCADCHTARNQEGAFVMEAWLAGAPIMFKPSVPMPVWADVAVPIAGLPTLPNDEDAIHFLMTGKKPDGQMARPPMPSFEFNRQDAVDAVAYLRSLVPPANN